MKTGLVLVLDLQAAGVRTMTSAIMVDWSKELARSAAPAVSRVQSFLDRTTTRRLGTRGMNSEWEELQRACRSIARLLERDRKSQCAEGYTETP